jgi:hypothetical protein
MRRARHGFWRALSHLEAYLRESDYLVTPVRRESTRDPNMPRDIVE